MEKIYIIIKPSVDGLTNEFDNDNIENNQNSYCKNELKDNNDDSNTQGNTTVPLENLFEEIPSSDAEDSVLKYVCTTQETSEYTKSFPALASIKKRKLDDMKRDMSNKNMPFKQSGQKINNINLQFRNTNNFNKNCNVSEEKSGPSKPTINSSKQLQDIAINCDTSSEENECPTDKDDFVLHKERL
ncbi:uncharacterized protein LOC143902082 [Temnothorax americanus]|uniref:uncharacterized protein LOC143902082 n=1 Tax=Temnothorax americanus TaxID=1964332 RepID=UPI0040693798